MQKSPKFKLFLVIFLGFFFLVTKDTTPLGMLHHWVSRFGIKFSLFKVASVIKTKVRILFKEMFLVQNINVKTVKVEVLFLLFFLKFITNLFVCPKINIDLTRLVKF